MEIGDGWFSGDLYIDYGDGEWVKLGAVSGATPHRDPEWPDVLLEDVLDAEIIGGWSGEQKM